MVEKSDELENVAPPIAPLLAARSARRVAVKVPQITVLFWVTKILTTGMGESTSDFLGGTFPLGLAVAATGVILAIALVVQFSMRRYVPVVYWFTVIMVSVFGTMAADGLHSVLHVPFIASATIFALVLGVVFVAWYLCEKTLSIHSIVTARREAFYWATVLATFALGTAAGDMTASAFDLGYLTSGILFALLIALPAIAYLKFRLNEVVAFWIAYVLTRPLGASFADWFAVLPKHGGLGFHTGPVSLALFVVIVVLVGVLAIREYRGRRRATFRLEAAAHPER